MPGELINNRDLELLVPPPDFGGGERDWRLNQSPMANDFQSCLCNEASLETRKDWVQRASVLVNTWRLRGNGIKFYIPSPVVALFLFHLAVPELYPFIIIQ